MQRAIIAVVMILIGTQGVFADIGYSDSPEFSLNLLGAGIAWADSSQFDLNLLGVRRAWADSAEFPITTESLFKVDFVAVAKRRVGRTIFDYDCKVTLTNNSTQNVRVTNFELQGVPANMSIIDGSVSVFDDIAAGGSATSADTCTFRVDRSQSITASQVTWQVTYEILGTSGTMQLSSLSELNLEPKVTGDITGDGAVDSADLMLLAQQWLSQPGNPSADVAPAASSEGIVNFVDYAVLAGHWLEGI
jgi:hypothetical protein